MKTSTTLLTQTVTQLKTFHDSYEIIESESVSNRNFDNITIAGALFSLSTFDRSNFSSCVFYATKIENCLFKGCTFKNCTFEFSHFYAAIFSSCHFINCKWQHSTSLKTKVKSSEVDHPTSSFIHQHDSNHRHQRHLCHRLHHHHQTEQM